MIDIDIRGQMYLSGLTLKERELIEKDLTYTNPKYEKIKKYSKWGSTREPKYIEYFNYFQKDGSIAMQVPIGYKLPDSILVNSVEDHRFTRIQKDFPKFLMTLRATQQEALDKYIECNDYKLNISGSVQMPTGKGKTILGLAIAEHYKCRTLIIVHKIDLVTGWKNDITDAFGGKADVGYIQGQKRKCGRHFTIATIQTLNNLDKKTLEQLYQTFGLVIQDEMHHCPSSSFSLADNFMSRYRLGLTATPERSDGLAHVMNLYYGDFCFEYGHRKDDEDILPVNVIRREVPVYFNPIVTKRGNNYALKDLNYAGNYQCSYSLSPKERRITDISFDSRPSISHMDLDKVVVSDDITLSMVCDDIMFEYEQGHSCIAFFTQKEHIELYYSKLIDLGVSPDDIGLYYGNNKDCDLVKETAEIKRQYITLATYSKATEGTNVKQWEVGFLVSSINNGKNVEQAVGRIRRTKPDCKLSKAKLYDYRYSQCFQLLRHGETRDKRYLLLKLDGGKKTLKRKLFSKGFKK